MEYFVFALLTIFLGLEIYGEQRQLIFQALAFHATDADTFERKNDDENSNGDNGRQHGFRAVFQYSLRSWLYTLFIGFRIYFVASTSLASACLIVFDGSVCNFWRTVHHFSTMH